jgi:hypothetical protein
MKRWMKWSVGLLIVVVGAVAIAASMLDRSARRAATNNGAFTDFHDVSAAQLEQQVRGSLPIGSSRTTVEKYLTKRGIQSNFDSSKNEIDAVARYLKDSSFVVRSDMLFELHFDQTGELQSIHSKVELTGP